MIERHTRLPVVSLTYGQPPGGVGGFPLAVQMWSVCDRHPNAYPSPPALFPFRGVQAAFNPYGDAFEIYTRRVAIVIFAYLGRPLWQLGKPSGLSLGLAHRDFSRPLRGRWMGSCPARLDRHAEVVCSMGTAWVRD
jgi:hypothetical protein